MPSCPNCGAGEPDGASFCGECGTSLAVAAHAPAAVTCPSCGNEEPEGSRFCGNCGATFVDGTESAGEIAPPEDTATLAPTATARTRRRPPRAALIGVLVLLGAAAVAAVLLGTGVVGGDSSEASESSFAAEANERLDPLADADRIASLHARTAAGQASIAGDGARIVAAAHDAGAYLRSLGGLSDEERRDVAVLVAMVAANQRYGEALAAFDPADGDSQFALEGAAAEARAALAALRGQLPEELRLPPQASFVSLRAAPSPTVTVTTTETTTTAPVTTAPQPDFEAEYVQQVDALLGESHAVVLGLRSFIPRAASGAIGKGAAVTTAQAYLDRRRRELAQAEALTAPPAFARAQALLVQSLQASAADDEALVAWTVARRDGSGDAQASLDEVNRIGAQATALKRQFLRVYGPTRHSTTGRSPAGLPDTF